MSLIDRVGPLFLKAASIGALTILLLWPLGQVENLIEERQRLEQQAHERIVGAWGGEQWASGPLLTAPVQKRTWVPYESAQDRTERWIDAAPVTLLADDLKITSQLRVTYRESGIYRLPVYEIVVTTSGSFAQADLAAWAAAATRDERARWQQAALVLPVLELARVRAVRRFDLDGRTYSVTAGEVSGLPALLARVDLSAAAGAMDGAAGAGRIPFRVEYTLAGSQALRFLPTARRTEVSAAGNWSAPRFDGATLPVSPRLSGAGFNADWQMLEINHGLPTAWRGAEVGREALSRAAFGFDLFQPGDVYARNWRAVRYGVLFIAMTFLCLFVWEHGGAARRLHAMHYLLVGLALAVFYLLLLSLSEHVGFAGAYSTSGAVLVALLSWYVAGVMQGWKPAATLAAVLGTAYAALYAVLDSEDYALLLGSAMVFAALATLMIATRRLDWTALGRRPE